MHHNQNGRRNKKQKKHNAPDGVIDMPEETSTKKSTAPDKTPEKKEIDKQTRTEFQPPESMIQWWLLLTAIIVAIIYGFQLRAMLDSNALSREALESVQRATVNVRPLKISPHVIHTTSGDIRTHRIEAIWVNYGPTQAKNFVSYFNLEELDTEPTEEKFLGPNPLPIEAAPTTLPPSPKRSQS